MKAPSLTLKRFEQSCLPWPRRADCWSAFPALIAGSDCCISGTAITLGLTVRCWWSAAHRRILTPAWMTVSLSERSGMIRQLASEYGGVFRSDLQSFLDDASIDAAIDIGRPAELPPQDKVQYFAFVDSSAGIHDAFTIGICHLEPVSPTLQRIVADVIRGTRPPFDPATVAAEYAKLAADYGCSTVTGDAFAGLWTARAFEACSDVAYERSPLNKSQLYLEGLQWFARGLISIPDLPRLVRELRLLERKTSRIGRDSVDHPKGQSDDLANCLFGSMYLAAGKREQRICMVPPYIVSPGPRKFPGSGGGEDNPALGYGSRVGESAMDRASRGQYGGDSTSDAGFDWGFSR
jgi:hypothetical protein